jgi:hypothetical protein
MIDLVKIGQEEIGHRGKRTKEFSEGASDVSCDKRDGQRSQKVGKKNSRPEDMMESAIGEAQETISNIKHQETGYDSQNGITPVQLFLHCLTFPPPDRNQ